MHICHRLFSFGLVLSAAAACGGTNAKPAAPVPVDDPEPEPAVATKVEPAPEPPKPPKVVRAKAALTPVKGSKLKPLLVAFTQRQDEPATVEADALEGVKPGTYWLVIHDGDTCGPNATKAGAAWAGAAEMKIVIAKDLTGGLEDEEATLTLDGETGALGHALVLHEDKKGKPAKAIACGVLEEVDE